MVSVSVVIGVLAALVLLLGGFLFFLLRNTRFKLLGFIILGAVAFVGYGAMFCHVYILDDAVEGRYEEKIALFSSEFTFGNGEKVTVSPQGSGVRSLILNNTDKQRIFSLMIYSTRSNFSNRIPPQKLLPYTVSHVKHSVDYIYEKPPSTISTKSKSDVYKGWIR